ncbi:TonB-dependent receptor [Olivibacter sp. SDN3]|uniref:TonB-dependent receptor n=1 Tax=Olivibacter sp. SDN3 TaxID=2764720 RepID=UPI001650E5CC|nr:TonB-dependent receptor [Olivibacter sp. SDN3]QNL47839.1 TonB-dependent receptor [Olivibacter sp. SDN3]
MIKKILSLWKIQISGAMNQLLFVMRITAFLLFVACMHLSATSLSQTMSLHAEGQSLQQIFAEVKVQTGYLVIYSNRVIGNTKPVNIQVKDMPLEAFLTKVLQEQSLTYTVKEKNILIKRLQEDGQKSQGLITKQEIMFSGRVLDEQGLPIPAVSIALKDGTQSLTSTDSEGYFKVNMPKVPVVVVFSSIGYVPAEREILGNDTLQITLRSSVADLNEVVVVGYGTQRRSDITGAIASVKMDDLNGVPIRSMDQALQGRVSGVMMSQTGGQPGAGNSIRIRGGNSITGSNEPLYVIDGIPVYVSPTDATSLNPLNSISPTDIVSVQVLKDASATAIYGARGGNGVVLITTRRGKSGQTNISLNASTGFQKEIKRLDLLTAKEFELLANEASVSEGGPQLYDPALNPQTTDWQEALFRDGAPLHDYQLSASGGGEDNQYLLSLGYFNQQGIMESSDIERYSTRLNMDRNIGKRIKIGNNLTFSHVTTNRVNSASMFSMLTTPPDLPVFQRDGSYTRYNQQGIGFNNPVGLMNDYKNFNRVFRGLGNVFASIELLEGLSFKTMWGLDANFMKNDSYMPQTVDAGALVGGEGTVSTNQTFIWINENTLNFNRQFGQHRVDALLGYTQQSSRYEALGASATGFLNDNTSSNDLGLGNPDQAVLPTSQTANWTILSWIARVNYGWSDKYLLTLTGRYDGSSRFGANNRWGLFPSVAVAWRLVEEDMVKNWNVFSDLKLRASYGTTGNQDGIGNYPALDLWGGANYVLGNQIVTGITPTQIANRNLRWESTASTDIGLEMGFLDNRITFTADVYYKKTRNLLLDVTVPATSGFVEGTKNIGSLENKGLELTLNAVPLQGEFSWDVGFNISWNRNKILSLGNADQIIPAGVNTTLLKVGEPLGNFLGYISDGLFQSIEEVAEGAQPNASPGDVRFIDFNGDGIINAADRRVMGNAQPNFYGGLNNRFAYKGFDLSFFLQFVYGNAIFNQNTITLEDLTGLRNQSRTVLNRWTPDNRDTEIPRATTVKPNNDAYDRYVEDGSYLRLKNVQLSYQIPLEKVTQQILKQLTLFANAQNLFTLTNYSGMDPETNRYGSNNVRQGYDSAAYPNVKTFTFGVRAGF